MTTHTNIALIDGEINVYSGDKRRLIATTEEFSRKLANIAQLDRKHFVKPKVDVEELAEKIAHNSVFKALDRPSRGNTRVIGIPAFMDAKNLQPFIDQDLQSVINKVDYEDKNGIKAGYNAKEAEFTREEMEAAYACGVSNGYNSNIIDGFNKFMNSLHTLSLPKSVTLNENNEITNVQW